MIKKHTKSPCCSAPVRRYGKRRRQCGKCKTTWRIRQKKRGRKTKRTSSRLVIKYLARHIATIRILAERHYEGKSSAQRALAKSLNHFIRAHPACWETRIPATGDLLLIADAIWYHILGKKYTIYLLLLRPRTDEEAIIWLPHIAAGHEDIRGWHEAIATIPHAIQARIGAIICDGGTGIVSYAHQRGWLLQRCHFHLLAAVQNYLTTGPRSRQRPFALRVMWLTQTVLCDSDGGAVQSALHTVDAIRRTTRSRGLRRTLGGILLHWREYRTYREYPEWRFPATSNAAESCIQCIRDLLYRCRGFRSKRQLIRWLTAFTIYKKTIRCRPKYQPN